MDLKEIVKIQNKFDIEHGWTPDDKIDTIIEFINKDIIGIIGELGEFSNQIKKLNLLIDSNKLDKLEELYLIKKENLSEELVDIFIYLIRISSHIGVNLEKEYFSKLEKNKIRFKEFKINE